MFPATLLEWTGAERAPLFTLLPDTDGVDRIMVNTTEYVLPTG